MASALYLVFERKLAKGLFAISNFSAGRETVSIRQYVALKLCVVWASDSKFFH